MTILQNYIKQLHLEQLAVDLLSKLVSLLLLLLFFFIAKRLFTYLFNQAVTKSIALTK